MIDIYTIASKPYHIADKCRLERNFKYITAYQARPGMILPIIIKESDHSKLIMARWGIESKKEKMATIIGTDRILSNRPYNIWIRNQRCAVPANCFFGINKKQVFLIRLVNPRLFCMGGMFTKTKETEDGKTEYQFILLKTESADILSSNIKEMPVMFSTANMHTWLQSKHISSIMDFADRSGSHWFDFFKVDPKILDEKINDKNLLKPVGVTLQQLKKHKEKLDSIEFEEERANRRSMKH
ncbi:MAG: SOS response-associated peptidase family protein [Bacteroidetes bacterium]|nr:SOS response-associated peptidase family protein [Bacteroidota bacterium]